MMTWSKILMIMQKQTSRSQLFFLIYWWWCWLWWWWLWWEPATLVTWPHLSRRSMYWGRVRWLFHIINLGNTNVHTIHNYTTRKAFLWPSNNPLKAFNTIWQASVSFSWAVVSNLDPNSHWRLLSSNPISGFDLCTFVFVVVFFVLVSVFVFILVYVFVFISVIVSLWHLLPSNSLSSIGKCFSWLAQEVSPQEHEVLLLRSIQLNCQFLEVAQLVSYPTRWSLYSSLDFCVDHLSWQWGYIMNCGFFQTRIQFGRPN